MPFRQLTLAAQGGRRTSVVGPVNSVLDSRSPNARVECDSGSQRQRVTNGQNAEETGTAGIALPPEGYDSQSTERASTRDAGAASEPLHFKSWDS